MADLRYPVGKYQPTPKLSPEERRAAIEDLAATPGRLRAAVTGLTPAQLDTPYRPEGWTVRQVIHHLPDSHVNAYVRFKLALTENEPVIKPYDEARWAELPDSSVTPVETSLALLGALHERWVVLLQEMSAGQFARRAKSSRAWRRYARRPDGDVRLARQAPCRAHHVAARTSGMGLNVPPSSYFDFSGKPLCGLAC
jgi:DinB superfamily